MLEIGNGGLNAAEEQTHMSLWSLVKAPLLVGCDVTNMTEHTLALLTNAEVIAVNQDPMAVQGHRIWNDTYTDVWAGPLVNERFAVVLWNRNASSAVDVTVEFAEIGATASSYTVRDLWSATDLGSFSGSFTAQGVEVHASRMLVLTPAGENHGKKVLEETIF
jgi:alpha-galactosidase